MKLCECGCGQPAPVAKMTAKRLGHIKGQSVRFVQGHWARTDAMRGPNNPGWHGGRIIHASGYIMVQAPDHVRANNGGYVLEHILVAEHAIGKLLPPQAEVHHVNEIKSENRGSNLVLCEDRAYHQLLHRRLRAYRACGNPRARQCWLCKKWGSELSAKKGVAVEHRECGNAYRRRKELERKNT